MFSFIIFSFLIFLISVFGILINRKHIIILLICLELMLLSSSINFVLFSFLFEEFLGQIYVLLILVIAASESALGLALVVVYYRLRGSISLDLINLLKS